MTYRRMPRHAAACPVCGTSFMTTGQQIYCSVECRDRRRRAAHYGREVVPPGRSFTCAFCGTRCVVGENVSYAATRFCSRKCKRRYHRPVVPKVERKRREAVKVLKLKGSRTFTAGYCAECGDPFVANGPAMFCSRRCMRRPRNRARRAATRGLKIATRRIAERDGWTCGICGDPVDGSLKAPDPMAPSLDHIVPLSRGGPHALENVQLAHYWCNTFKGTRALEEFT